MPASTSQGLELQVCTIIPILRSVCVCGGGQTQSFMHTKQARSYLLYIPSPGPAGLTHEVSLAGGVHAVERDGPEVQFWRRGREKQLNWKARSTHIWMPSLTLDPFLEMGIEEGCEVGKRVSVQILRGWKEV